MIDKFAKFLSILLNVFIINIQPKEDEPNRGLSQWDAN